ncbi:hypothetical protein KTQ96_11340 [Prevotella copri]|uniref:hypothetical protein n=1 Tax=Segatella copri TaxID=165179 RepID=UPI001C2C5F18|nr:hypothetical protein [Segatella copri]MBU9908523.1 hypothetical protein [Segatella copri]MBV3374018.1 hypothetical protein [Segatella copri]
MTHPDGYFNSYGSCSRHVLGISIFPVGKNYFPSWKKDFPRHKKSLRLEAIGDNGHPAGLITIFL